MRDILQLLATQCLFAALLCALVSAEEAPAPGKSESSKEAPAKDGQSDDQAYDTLSLRGRVVYLAPALEKRFGAKAVPEARERILALESPDGVYTPIFEDVRGRAFRKDARLRGIDLELLVRQYEGSPMVQVIQVFALEDGKKYELDYWCEICAIAMFELKDCDCCQGPIELRRRLVKDSP
jgi:hypothetical protein